VSDPQDFAALFAASNNARQVSRGQTIEGRIVAIGSKVAFVDVGGKGEAEIDIEELRDADGAIAAAVGDRIQAKVVSTSGGIVLSRQGVRNAATQRELEDAFRSGLAVEGKVVQEMKAATKCAWPVRAPSARSRRSTSFAPPIPPYTSVASIRSA